MYRLLALGAAFLFVGCGPSPQDVSGDWFATGIRELRILKLNAETQTIDVIKTFTEEFFDRPRRIIDKGAFQIVTFENLLMVANTEPQGPDSEEVSGPDCSIPVRMAGNDGLPASAAYVGSPGARCFERMPEFFPENDAQGNPRIDGRQVDMFMTDCVSDLECAAAEVRFEGPEILFFSIGEALVDFPAGHVFIVNGQPVPLPEPTVYPGAFRIQGSLRR